MNDQALAAIIDRATTTVNQSMNQAQSHREVITERIGQTRFDEAQCWAGMDNVEIMKLLVAQITLQVAAVELLNDIKAALHER